MFPQKHLVMSKIGPEPGPRMCSSKVSKEWVTQGVVRDQLDTKMQLCCLLATSQQLFGKTFAADYKPPLA
jgi:hypothetical protein